MSLDSYIMTEEKINDLQKVTWEALRKYHILYLKEEPRDAIYQVSTRIINDNWGVYREISNAIGVLLLIWNSAFYRYGSLDYDLIEESIIKSKVELNLFRNREILSLGETDRDKTELIYVNFLLSLRSKGRFGTKNAGKISYSPVSVGKALHLLCPTFFPLWDNKIAKSYDCLWRSSTSSFDNYWKFMGINKQQIFRLYKDHNIPSDLNGLNPLKLIDEYNYARFTLGIIIT